MGIVPVLLGKRILRAETVPLCILSIIHYQAELNAGKGYGNGKRKDISYDEYILNMILSIFSFVFLLIMD